MAFEKCKWALLSAHQQYSEAISNNNGVLE
jgi:hypothetical protein